MMLGIWLGMIGKHLRKLFSHTFKLVLLISPAQRFDLLEMVQMNFFNGLLLFDYELYKSIFFGLIVMIKQTIQFILPLHDFFV